MHQLFFFSGYSRQYKGLKEFLSSQPSVKDSIKVVGRRDTGITGNFEVRALETGQVLHSKRHAGQGRAQTDAERMAILEQIEELLDDM